MRAHVHGARTARGATTVAVLLLVLVSLPGSAPPRPWQVYAFRDGAFRRVVPAIGTYAGLSQACGPEARRATAEPQAWPGQEANWRVTASTLADVTGDALAEWVMVVWRPWRDWPIQRWSEVPSPIAGFHDATGDSCHLIMIDPHDGHQIWAGSALPTPLLELAVGDVDGDTYKEVVALEGNYATGRDGPATGASVWKWNGFGFTAAWRSLPAILEQLCLTDTNGDGILDVIVR